jgi:hypothetical protein
LKLKLKLKLKPQPATAETATQPFRYAVQATVFAELGELFTLDSRQGGTGRLAA